MRTRFVTVLAAGLIVMSLTGCGENQIPEMTDDQIQILAEHTAITLMKHDASNRSRLVDYARLMATPEPVVTQEPEPDKPSGMDPVDDTPIVGGPASGNGSGAYSMEEVLELPEGVTIVYMGEALYDSYPEEGSFTISASAGKRLLVLDFVIINASEQEQRVDILSLSSEFRITVNGENARRALPTWMEEDLSVYQGTIPGMGSVSTILAVEVDEADAENLTSISLSLKNDSKAYTIQLL